MQHKELAVGAGPLVLGLGVVSQQQHHSQGAGRFTCAGTLALYRVGSTLTLYRVGSLSAYRPLLLLPRLTTPTPVLSCPALALPAPRLTPTYSTLRPPPLPLTSPLHSFPSSFTSSPPHPLLPSLMPPPPLTDPRRPQHLTLSVATATYLLLPPRGRLAPGHCCICPSEHVASMRQLDEHVWTEVRNFQKCLVQMFAAKVGDQLIIWVIMRFGTPRFEPHPGPPCCVVPQRRVIMRFGSLGFEPLLCGATKEGLMVG